MDEISRQGEFSARLAVETLLPLVGSLAPEAVSDFSSLANVHGNDISAEQRARPHDRQVRKRASIPEKAYWEIFDAAVSKAASVGLEPKRLCPASGSLHSPLWMMWSWATRSPWVSQVADTKSQSIRIMSSKLRSAGPYPHYATPDQVATNIFHLDFLPYRSDNVKSAPRVADRWSPYIKMTKPQKSFFDTMRHNVEDLCSTDHTKVILYLGKFNMNVYMQEHPERELVFYSSTIIQDFPACVAVVRAEDTRVKQLHFFVTHPEWYLHRYFRCFDQARLNDFAIDAAMAISLREFSFQRYFLIVQAPEAFGGSRVDPPPHQTLPLPPQSKMSALPTWRHWTRDQRRKRDQWATGDTKPSSVNIIRRATYENTDDYCRLKDHWADMTEGHSILEDADRDDADDEAEEASDEAEEGFDEAEEGFDEAEEASDEAEEGSDEAEEASGEGMKSRQALADRTNLIQATQQPVPTSKPSIPDARQRRNMYHVWWKRRFRGTKRKRNQNHPVARKQADKKKLIQDLESRGEHFNEDDWKYDHCLFKWLPKAEADMAQDNSSAVSEKEAKRRRRNFANRKCRKKKKKVKELLAEGKKWDANRMVFDAKTEEWIEITS